MKLSCHSRKPCAGKLCANVPSWRGNIAHSTENYKSMIGFNRYTFTLLIRTNAGVTNFSKRFNLVTFESFTKITKFERLRIIVYQTGSMNLATTPTGKGDYQMNGSRNNDNWEAYPFRAMHRRLTSTSKYMRHYGPAIAIAGGCW